MKLLALILVPFIVLPFCSCETSVDFSAGKYRTMGDNADVEMTAHNGQITSYKVKSNTHTAVTRANWSGAGSLAGQAVAFAGGPGVGAGVVGLTQVLNRPTSRPVSTSKP